MPKKCPLADAVVIGGEAMHRCPNRRVHRVASSRYQLVQAAADIEASASSRCRLWICMVRSLPTLPADEGAADGARGYAEISAKRDRVDPGVQASSVQPVLFGLNIPDVAGTAVNLHAFRERRPADARHRRDREVEGSARSAPSDRRCSPTREPPARREAASSLRFEMATS